MIAPNYLVYQNTKVYNPAVAKGTAREPSMKHIDE